MTDIIENSIEICECGHERRDHYRGRGKCHQCQANTGLRCSHFRFPVTEYGIFYASLLETYKQMRAPEILGLPKIFVPITELRTAVCKKLNLTKNKFDELLRYAALGDVRLHGAPTDAYVKVKHPFEYEHQLFLYLSMDV